MNESKHILTSKIFIAAIVTIIANIAVAVARKYGYDLSVTPETQSSLTVIVMGFIAYFRTLPAKPVHFKKKDKNESNQ